MCLNISALNDYGVKIQIAIKIHAFRNLFLADGLNPICDRHLERLIGKTAMTLTPPTVGRHSADLSTDQMPDFRSFSSADKK